MTATTYDLTHLTTKTGPKPLWKPGLAAAGVAAVATTITAAVADAAGVPLEIQGEAIPMFGYAQLTIFFSIVGIAIAAGLRRWADRPRHTFVVTTVVLTALSIVPDVLADATVATRFVLALTHVVAAAIVVPVVAARLAD